MKYRYLVSLAFVLIGLCVYLFVGSYQDAQKRAIDELNSLQMLYARQAAKGIEGLFDQWSALLRHISEDDDIISFHEKGKKGMDSFFAAHKNEIKAITRIDARGRIVYTVPRNSTAIGSDVSSQEHVREILRTHKPVVSDVFKAVQGYETIALHVPVFRNGSFAGTIGILVDFQGIAKKYLQDIRIGNSGYAWMISAKGIELYCPVPGHMGRPVSETCREFPSVLAMANEMMKGRQGLTTYTFDRIRDRSVETSIKHAVYMPVRIGNTFWSIVVATPEDEIVASLATFRNKLTLAAALFLLVLFFSLYIGIKSRLAVREEAGRQEADRALRKSEEKYRNLFENAVEGFFQSTPEGRFMSVNPAFARIFGYASPDELTTSITDIAEQYYIDPEDRGRYKKLLSENGSVEHFEFRARRKDGSQIWVSNSTRAIYNEDGGIARYEGIVEDITERKQAQDNLKKAEREKAIILDTMSEIVVYIDRDMKVVWANRAMYDALDLSPETFIGGHCYQLHKRQSPCSFCPAIKALETGEPQVHDDLKSYGKRWVLRGHAVRDEDGRIVGAVEIVTDVTAIRNALDALRESEEKYRLLADHATLAIVIVQDAVLKYANPYAIRILGYPPETLSDKAFMELIHPDDREMVVEMYAKRLRGEPVPASYTARVVIKSGEYLWGDFGGVIIDWQGKPASLIFVRDITQQKNLEQQLIRAQKLEAVGTLAGGIAHDFNNLLMAIQGHASLMLMNMDRSHPHFERLEQIEKQVISGADLTKRLLGFARGGRYEIKPTDMNKIIDKATAMFGRTKKEIPIHIKAAEDLWAVEVDQGQMEQVFMNLYVNAWQAMPGGGDIYLETLNVVLAKDDISPYTIKPGKYIKVFFTDTGVGMDEKTQQKIFDPFFTTKEMGRGTGLGLAMVYGIIKSHEGMINVYSEPGHGTTFTIYLPASEKEIAGEHKAPTGILKGTETILLADDEKSILDVSKEMLESLGYRVYLAGSGQEAIDVYLEKRSGIDLVILDMIMPGMSGGETFDRLREIDPGIRVLLSSGYSINGQAQKILDRGCLGFLQKPFHIRELSQKVRQALTA